MVFKMPTIRWWLMDLILNDGEQAFDASVITQVW